MATSPGFNLGKTGRSDSPRRGVNQPFQIISRKNVPGLKCFAGVKSLNERGNFFFGASGRWPVGFVMQQLDFNTPCAFDQFEN
jgi:hypothetical protein